MAWVSAGSLTTASAAALAGLPHIATAQEAAEPSAAAHQFLKLLAAGNLDEAGQRLARIESLSRDWEREFLVRDRDAILDRLSGCTTTSLTASGPDRFRIETAELDCDGEKLTLRLLAESDPANPYITIIGLADEAMIADRQNERPMMFTVPPPAPMPLRERTPEQVQAAAERQRLLEERRHAIAIRFGHAIEAGEYDSLSDLVSDDAQFIYQTRDPFFSVDIVARQGRGLEEGVAQFRQAREQLGEIIEHACERGTGAYGPTICRWTLRDPAHRMFAMLHFRGEELSSVQTFYVTRELVEQFARQAAERGVDVQAKMAGQQ